MTIRYTSPLLNIISRCLVAVTLALLPGAAQALDLNTYAAQSALSKGSWVKVQITQSGMHCISDVTLKSWGFADPSKVLVYGYGAKRLPDVLNSTYLDDVPQTISQYVPGVGIFFYAEGPTTWVSNFAGYYRPAHNPFTDTGYYFLSDTTGEQRTLPSTSGSAPLPIGVVDWFYDRIYHEKDEFSPGEAGFLLLGESFKYTRSQSFTFPLTDVKSGINFRMEASFMTKSTTSRGTVNYSVNGSTLPLSTEQNIAAVSDKYSHGNEALSRKEFTASGNQLSIGVSYSNSGTVLMANLNYISINYPRQLKMPASRNLNFWLTEQQRTALLSGATNNTQVWDVTNPQAISNVTLTAVANGQASWQTSYTGDRSYVAWEPNGTFPSPSLVGAVEPQNLHALATPEMVIFTPSEWADQAERLANYHRNHPEHPLDVMVLTPQAIYNEFSSGCPDVQALRKIMKMFYDRGKAEPSGKQLKYALIFSRLTYDYRRKTSSVASLGYPMLPAWFTDKGLNDNDSYTTDDIMAFLADDSGNNFGRDQLSISLGRLPVTSREGAKSAVDKILAYTSKAPKGVWRNNVLITADDQDSGVHMKDAEKYYYSMITSAGGSDAFYQKIYIDEYELIGNQYPGARAQFYRALDEGVLWWSFQGHANPSSLTGEGLVTYRDLNEFYLERWPVVYAATCDFIRWDSPTISGAEILFNNPDGGVIAAISATRPVYITDNGYLTQAFGNYMFSRDEDTGYLLPIGDIYREAKNHYRFNGAVVSNTNKLRYVLLGDPAMRFAMPSNRVVLDKVGDHDVTDIDNPDNEPVELMARQITTISGHIEDPKGNLIEDFNGLLTVNLFDAETSVTTRGNGEEGVPVTFDRQGGRLLIATDSIRNGRFVARIVMPAEVSNNYRPAAFNFFAAASNGREAAGTNRNLYVYGIDPNAEPDNVPPVIEQLYLNHPSFTNGQEVNSSPMLIARVTDDRAINLSTAGIGHQMSLMLDDGVQTFNNVAEFYTPFTDGTPGGTILYPLESLGKGNHSLRLRVWDTGPNSSESTIDFFVVENIAPVIYDVFTDVNPVSTEANFYISHDRPDRKLTVTVEVFDLMGRRLWQNTRTGRSDMFTSSPVTWNLCDYAGHRVNRGIYIYRATITDEESGELSSTASRKLAVKAQP